MTKRLNTPLGEELSHDEAWEQYEAYEEMSDDEMEEVYDRRSGKD